MTWRVGIISQVSVIAEGYARIVRELGHEPVVHLALRRFTVDAEPPDEVKPWVSKLLWSVPGQLDLVFPATRKSVAPLLRAYDLDLVICTAHPWRLPAEAIAAPRLGIVNGHPSKLPFHRGPTPVGWQIRDGADEIGLTYHLMDEQFDTGPVLAQGAVPFDDDDTDETLWAKLGGLSQELLPRVFERLEAGERGDPQEGGSYQSLFEDDYVPVDLSRSAVDVHRQVRAWAFTPFSAASERGPILERDGQRLRLKKTSLAEVAGAERLDCADAPLWLVESEAL